MSGSSAGITVVPSLRQRRHERLHGLGARVEVFLHPRIGRGDVRLETGLVAGQAARRAPTSRRRRRFSRRKYCCGGRHAAARAGRSDTSMRTSDLSSPQVLRRNASHAGSSARRCAGGGGGQPLVLRERQRVDRRQRAVELHAQCRRHRRTGTAFRRSMSRPSARRSGVSCARLVPASLPSASCSAASAAGTLRGERRAAGSRASSICSTSVEQHFVARRRDVAGTALRAMPAATAARPSASRAARAWRAPRAARRSGPSRAPWPAPARRPRRQAASPCRSATNRCRCALRARPVPRRRQHDGDDRDERPRGRLAERRGRRGVRAAVRCGTRLRALHRRHREEWVPSLRRPASIDSSSRRRTAATLAAKPRRRLQFALRSPSRRPHATLHGLSSL